MNWNDKTVLVTGAGGFIGSHLVEELTNRGAKVRALVRYNARGDWGNLDFLSAEVKAKLEVLSGDVRDPFFMDRAVEGAHTVFHLASLIAIPYSYAAPQSYVDTNISGTLNVLQAAMRHKTPKVIHTSTSETYGTALYTPIDEKHPLQGQSPYSASKIGADKLAESYNRSFDLPVATIRPFNTFGPRQSARAVIPTIISQALTRDHIELGSLSPVRDLTFVSDTVNGFLHVAQTEACVGEVTNVGNGHGITIGELARKILSLMNADLPIKSSDERVRPEKSEVFTLICDNSRAREAMGWRPQVSLDEGLAQVIEWVRANPSLFRAEEYTV